MLNADVVSWVAQCIIVRCCNIYSTHRLGNRVHDDFVLQRAASAGSGNRPRVHGFVIGGCRGGADVFPCACKSAKKHIGEKHMPFARRTHQLELQHFPEAESTDTN